MLLKTENLEWKNCCGLCTDGAKILVLNQNQINYDHITFAHCLIYREALATKNLHQN